MARWALVDLGILSNTGGFQILPGGYNSNCENNVLNFQLTNQHCRLFNAETSNAPFEINQQLWNGPRYFNSDRYMSQFMFYANIGGWAII